MSWSDCENADDEASRQSVQSIGSDSNSRYDEDSTSSHVDTDYQDIDSFIQAVETHSDLIGSCDPVIVEDGWRLVLEDGLRDNCDWAIDENNRLSRPSHNFTSESRLCKSIWNSILSRSKESLPNSSQAVGFKRTTYNEIKAYLLNGMVPDHVSLASYLTANFRKKCATYSLDDRGYLMYSRKGFTKYVLLEGEVKQVLQQMHPQLGHCIYGNLSAVFSAHFHVGFNIESVCKRYVSNCLCERSCTKAFFKNLEVIFKRENTTVCLHLRPTVIVNRVESCRIGEVCSEGSPGMNTSQYDELALYLRSGVAPRRLKDFGNFIMKSAKYIINHYGLVEKLTGRIVLSQRDSQAVLDDLHVTYGHQVQHLRAVVERRFICAGIQAASGSYLRTCRFCRMRPAGCFYSGSHFVENVDYDVLISWEGDLRHFTITPKGLERSAVDEYVRDVIERCGGLPDDDTSKANVPDKKLTDQQRAQYEKVRRIDETFRAMKRSKGTPSMMKVDFDCTDSENSNLPPLQAPPSVFRDSSRSFAQNSVKSEVKPILKKDQKRKKASKRRVRWSLDDAEPSNDENAPPRTDPVTGKRKPGLSISATSDIECPSSPRSATDFVQDEETSDRADHALFVDPIPSNDDEWSMDELSDMFSDEENNVIVKEDLNLASSTEDIDAPRAWQWSDMRPDEVYAYEEQMALQDFQQKQLDQNTLQHEVARLKVDEMRLQLADRLETETESTGTFIDLGMNSSKAITDDVPKAEPSSIVCDDDNYRELAVADPYLFEQPVGHSSTAEHLVSLDSQNPFDIATCRYSPGYNVWNGVAWPLNPGPIRNPYADIVPRTDLRATLNMTESDESDMEDCWSDDEGADGGVYEHIIYYAK